MTENLNAGNANNPSRRPGRGEDGGNKMLIDERDERLEASERASRYYEQQMIDEPPRDSEEWRERVQINLERIQEGR